MRRAAVLVSALVVLAAPVVTAGSAAAETWTHHDSRGDVLRFVLPDDEEQASVRRDSTNTSTDVTRLRVDHAQGAVIVTIKVRDLRGGYTLAPVRLVTPDEEYDLQAMRSPLGRMLSLTAKTSGAEVACERKRVRFDNARDRIRVRVPRACLGRPAWVRGGGGVLRSNLADEDTSSTVFTADEALRSGRRQAVLGDGPLKVGPPIHAG